MHKLIDSCNKEIFITFNNEKNDNNTPVKVRIFSEFIKLANYIEILVPNIDFNTKVLHGILTGAFYLPKNLKGKTAFIIIDNTNKSDHMLIIESGAYSDEDLAFSINKLLLYNKHGSTYPLKIEDIYIFYGYELSLTLSLDPEEIDEEIINTCQEIIRNTEMIKTTINGDVK